MREASQSFSAKKTDIIQISAFEFLMKCKLTMSLGSYNRAQIYIFGVLLEIDKSGLNSLTTKKADNKIFVCRFSKMLT